LANLIGVIPPARGALIVEVSPNVIPAKSANLLHDSYSETKIKGDGGSENHLVLALAWLEVQIRDIHFLEAKGALLRFLFKIQDVGV
jgi:hypothetical protein